MPTIATKLTLQKTGIFTSFVALRIQKISSLF
jgi:hypothetical protein